MPQGTSEAKALLRAEVRARRRARSEIGRDDVGARLAVRLGEVPELARLVSDPSLGCVAAYASYAGEPRTTQLRALLALSGVRVVLPVIAEDGQLDWAWDAEELSTSTLSRGIPEPDGDVVGHGADGLHSLGVRVVLVPATAVDRRGNRLGKGAGYYDRLFAALAAHPDTAPLLVAVVHDDEVVDEVPVERFDRPVDAILTPSAYLPLR